MAGSLATSASVGDAIIELGSMFPLKIGVEVREAM